MRIIQQIFLNQLFKIIRIQLFSQVVIHTQFLHMKERRIFIIQPAVHHLKAKHQPLREASEICFTEFKLRTIDRSQQCLFIDTVFHLLLQHITNYLFKTFLIRCIGMFCYNGKNWLITAAVIAAINISSNSSIQKRLFHRCTLCTQQCIVQNIEGNIEFSV